MMDLITSTEAAAIAGITPSTLRTLAAKPTTKSPPPPPIIKGGRGGRDYYDRAQIEEWAKQRDSKRGAAPSDH